VKKIFIVLLLLALSASATTAQIGNTVRSFTKSLIHDDLELKFLQVSKLSKGIFKFDGHYFLSQKADQIYLVGLVTHRGEDQILSQAIYFPDDPTKWNFFIIAEFLFEAVGWGIDIKTIIKTLRPMFKETADKFLMLDEYEKQHVSVHAIRELGAYKLIVKRIPAGDWVVTIADKKSRIGP
jgi:hypothetical protein